MAGFALFVPLEAKPGQEAALAEFLKQGEAMAREEAETVTWYAVQFGPGSFGIFDTFADENGRQAHLTGDIAKALMANVDTLLASPPQIRQARIIGRK